MTTVRVTVEMAVNGLPDNEARKHARSIVEARGLTVSSATVKKSADSDTAKPLLFKHGQPGQMVIHSGRRWQVWAPAPASYYGKESVWAVPAERSENDAAVYLLHLGYAIPPKPHNGRGESVVSLIKR